MATGQNQPKTYFGLSPYDFVAGFNFGVAVIVSGYPIDTVRVRMQTTQSLNSISGAFMETIKADGVRGLFKGMSYPLYTVPLPVAINLGAYQQAKRFLGVTEDNATFVKGVVCGSYANFWYALVTCPVETIKIQLQNQSENSKLLKSQGPKYTGPWHCTKHLIKEYGFLKLWTGLGPMVARDCFSWPFGFGAYEVMKNKMSARLEVRRDKMPLYAYWISGSIGGAVAWFFCLPLDQIKTNLQAFPEKFKPRYGDGGITECAKYLIKETDKRQFGKTWALSIARGALVNGLGFMSFEATKNFLYSRC